MKCHGLCVWFFFLLVPRATSANQEAKLSVKENFGDILVHTTDVQRKDEVEQFPLERAAADLSIPENVLTTRLHIAAQDGRVGDVMDLIDEGANIEAADDSGRTPLFYAVASGKAKVVTVLLDRGADIEAMDGNLMTPLHFAIESGNKEVVNVLLDSGANIEAMDDKERTPLHYAAATGRIAIVKILLEAGASKNAEDGYGRTPYDDVCTYSEANCSGDTQSELLSMLAADGDSGLSTVWRTVLIVSCTILLIVLAVLPLLLRGAK